MFEVVSRRKSTEEVAWVSDGDAIQFEAESESSDVHTGD